MIKRLFLIAFLLSLLTITTSALESTSVVYEQVTVYTGPGDTYTILGILNPGLEVFIIERNLIGNWLHIIHSNDEEEINGWVLIGYLSLSNEFTMSDLPISDLPDAMTNDIPDDDIIRLYDTPIIPSLSEAMIEVYERGLRLGNLPNVVSKIGDSNSANGRYLKPIANGFYNLGAYDHLQDLIDWYGDSFANVNIAARIGLNAASVFDPVWSHGTHCKPDEAPLHCEYRYNKPSIALVMFGQNDTRVLNSDTFDEQMRLIVETSLELGVIPVLINFSSNDSPENQTLYWQTVRFNIILLNIAEEYNAPLVNFWSAARILPARGIGPDNAHLTGGADSVNFLGTESRQGVPLLNLITLTTLDQIHHVLQ